MSAKLTERQEAERASWQYRAVAACRGNSTRLGAILLATLERAANNPPWIGPFATIHVDGRVTADFVTRYGAKFPDHYICKVGELQDWFRKLADEIKATDEERHAMFSALRAWIHHDKRVVTNLFGENDR